MADLQSEFDRLSLVICHWSFVKYLYRIPILKKNATDCRGMALPCPLEYIDVPLINEYQRLIHEYQRLINEYQRLIHEYQRLINEYQRLIHEYQRLINEY